MKQLKTTLDVSKKNKNDEFYTLYTTIENELIYYNEKLKGKIVYCNCDKFENSNFVKFFKTNFSLLGLKCLISTNYNKEGQGTYYMYDGINEDVRTLKSNGDFRNQENIDILKISDVVITNPPFSLFREYVAQLFEYGKDFLIIGNLNAITYKEIFPLIKENRLWLGISLKAVKCEFIVPDDYEMNSCFEKDGVKYGKVNNAVWFTNMDNIQRKQEIPLTKDYNTNVYYHYDNYDGINIDKLSDIPFNYDKAMGVPITFLLKYNPKQFEIIKFRKGNDDKDLAINGKTPYFRILIKRVNE